MLVKEELNCNILFVMFILGLTTTVAFTDIMCSLTPYPKP